MPYGSGWICEIDGHGDERSVNDGHDAEHATLERGRPGLAKAADCDRNETVLREADRANPMCLPAS